MREPMIEKVLTRLEDAVRKATRAGAAAKVSFSHGESTSCIFESGRLKRTGLNESYSFSIEVIVAGKRGGASGNRMEQLDQLVERALTLAKVGSAAHIDKFPTPAEYTKVKRHSERTLSLTRDRMIADCQKIVDALKSYNSKLHISAGASLSESEGVMITSGGVCHTSRQTGWGLHGGAQRTDGTDIMMAGYGRGWGDLNELYDPDEIIRRTLWDLKMSERQAEPPTGHVQAYFPPEHLWMFYRPVAMGINGRNVAKGDSPLAGRLGQQVLADSLTIIDNPHVDFSGGGAELDGSGIPTKKQTLFDKGVLQRFLYDMDTAGLAGAEPTGNNGCGAYYPMISPGTQSSEELLRSIDDGVYIKSLIGYGQGNIINGDFSCNIGLGYRIKNGEIIGRIKDTMMAGNIYELFGRNVRLSSDMDPEGRTPHGVIEGLSVTAKK